MRKTTRLFILLPLTALGLACPGHSFLDPGPSPLSCGFYILDASNESVDSLQAGTFSYSWSFSWYGGPSPKTVKYIFSEPGEFFEKPSSSYDYSLNPIDPSKEYPLYHRYLEGIYRPPASDAVPPEGVIAKIAIEINPGTPECVRSPYYDLRVFPREDPMEIYVTIGQQYLPTEAYVLPGGVYSFTLWTKPMPVEDIQLQYALVRPEGYFGELGELSLKPVNYWRPLQDNSFTYTAPDSVTSPVDIVARFSIYDPWIKNRQNFEFTFHLTTR
jgi:hypothetical protein